MTPDEILDGASKIVEERWCQGSLARRRTGQKPLVCAVGAMNETDMAAGPWMAAANALMARIGGSNIATWNDTPGRTASEVAETMREAACDIRIAAYDHK